MQVTATHKYLRMSPRKVRLLLPQLRGASTGDALALLRLMPQSAALPVGKVVKSAVANAEHNFSLDPKTLVIEKITADEGPVLKRYMPRARGSADMIRKRTTHLTVVVRDIPQVKQSLPKSIKDKAKKAVPRKKPAKKDEATAVKPDAVKEESKAKAPAMPSEQKKAPEIKSAGAEAAPRRTSQQTGRAATTRSNRKTSGNKRGDKS